MSGAWGLPPDPGSRSPDRHTCLKTIMGDIAVSPTDERYQDLLGKEVWRPFPKARIPVVALDHVDVELGTGVLKALRPAIRQTSTSASSTTLRSSMSFTKTALSGNPILLQTGGYLGAGGPKRKIVAVNWVATDCGACRRICVRGSNRTL
ncbi:MAG: hypothetical protein AAF191_09920 [Verrucomicrobiota bacterium]